MTDRQRWRGRRSGIHHRGIRTEWCAQHSRSGRRFRRQRHEDLPSNGTGLTTAYAGVSAGLAGTPARQCLRPEAITITGKGGDDIIYGDVLFTDTLAAAKGITTLAAGSGWAVFSLLETGAVAGSTSWTRAGTLAYIQSHQAELAGESGRSGGNDTINGGGGNDVVYGQER